MLGVEERGLPTEAPETLAGAERIPDDERRVMERFRPRLEELHYDPARYDTYLEQLGVDYPRIERPREQD